jgi:hypothetical protein
MIRNLKITLFVEQELEDFYELKKKYNQKVFDMSRLVADCLYRQTTFR